MMHGIMISREGPGGSPVIYIDDAYDLYQSGRTVDELAPAAADAFCKAWEDQPCMDLLSLQYEDIKDRIFYRIKDASNGIITKPDIINIIQAGESVPQLFCFLNFLFHGG